MFCFALFLKSAYAIHLHHFLDFWYFVCLERLSEPGCGVIGSETGSSSRRGSQVESVARQDSQVGPKGRGSLYVKAELFKMAFLSF